MNELKLYPKWKETKRHILKLFEKDQEAFLSIKDMEKMFEARKDTKEWAFAYLALKAALLDEDGVCLIPVRGVGYKVASASEKVRGVTDGYRRRVIRSLRTERKILVSVDPGQLDEEEVDIYKRKLTRGCLMAVAIENTKLYRVKADPKYYLNNDKPKMIGGDDDA